MGNSGWRAEYRIAHFSAEMLRAIDLAGLADVAPPVVVGHSFGGIPLMYTAAHHGDRIAGGIMVDSFVPPPDRGRPSWAVSGKPLPRYATEAEALARYRFAPPQTSDHPEIVDHLARHSIRQVAADDDGPAGWTWKFDPRMWATLDRHAADPLVEQVRAPIGLIFGEESGLVTDGHAATLAARLPDCRFVAAVPHARHHIMVDQPMALIAALRVGIAALETPMKHWAIDAPGGPDALDSVRRPRSCAGHGRSAGRCRGVRHQLSRQPHHPRPLSVQAGAPVRTGRRDRRGRPRDRRRCDGFRASATG